MEYDCALQTEQSAPTKASSTQRVLRRQARRCIVRRVTTTPRPYRTSHRARQETHVHGSGWPRRRHGSAPHDKCARLTPFVILSRRRARQGPNPCAAHSRYCPSCAVRSPAILWCVGSRCMGHALAPLARIGVKCSAHSIAKKRPRISCVVSPMSPSVLDLMFEFAPHPPLRSPRAPSVSSTTSRTASRRSGM